MKWILNVLFALGLLLLIGLELYPQMGKAFHRANSVVALKGQYSQKTINTFLDHGFGTTNGRNGSVARKWEHDIRVKIHGTPDAADTKFLQSNIELLDTLTGSTRISIVDGDQDDANLQIHIIPRAQFNGVLPQYRNRLHLSTFALCYWNRDSEIYKVTILVDQKLEVMERHTQILRLLARNLGPVGFSLTNEQSVFAEATRVDYSQLDKDVIRLLYEEAILCGMTEPQARERLWHGILMSTGKEEG